MKKLYIPTSSLNLNNILSSESISPKAFYTKRDFGYSRWENIPENNYDNAITLYDTLCKFTRPKSDLEDHPLLIEVNIEEEHIKNINDHTFYCDHTIYLTPASTRFIFFTEEDMRIALSMTNGSLETKMVKLYENNFYVEQPTETYSIENIELEIKLNESEIEKDYKLNKLKGLLYGYYIGALLSTDISKVIRLNSLYEIDGIFAAINSSLDKTPTDYQYRRLFYLFQSEEDRNEYKNLLQQTTTENKEEETFFKFYQFFSKIISNNQIDKLLFSLKSDTIKDDEIHPTIQWIKDKIAEYKKDIWTNRKKLTTSSEEIIIANNELSKVATIPDNIAFKLFSEWINIIICDKYNGKINTYKKEFADKITLCAKDEYGAKWNEENVTRRYLNTLRKHIAGEEFIEKFNNGLLASMSANIIAGEDWNVLLRFMQKNEMTEYKTAFAIYGILNGFANLTRDFTDILLDQDSSYVNDVYKEFHGQLHGTDCGDINIINQPKKQTITETISHGIKNLSQGIKNAFTSSIPEKKEEDNLVATSDKIEENDTLVSDTPEQLKPFFATAEFRSLAKEAQEFVKPKVIEIFIEHGQTLNEEFKEATKKIEFPKPEKRRNKICTKKNWEECLKFFATKKSTTKKNHPSDEIDMFMRGHFIGKLESTQNITSGRILQRLIDNWDYVSKKETNKQEQIKFFINLCKKEGRGESKTGNKELIGYFTSDIAEMFEKEIKEKYL